MLSNMLMASTNTITAKEDDMSEARNKEGCFLSLSRHKCERNSDEGHRADSDAAYIVLRHPSLTSNRAFKLSFRKPPNRQSSARRRWTLLPLIVRACTNKQSKRPLTLGVDDDLFPHDGDLDSVRPS